MIWFLGSWLIWEVGLLLFFWLVSIVGFWSCGDSCLVDLVVFLIDYFLPISKLVFVVVVCLCMFPFRVISCQRLQTKKMCPHQFGRGTEQMKTGQMNPEHFSWALPWTPSWDVSWELSWGALPWKCKSCFSNRALVKAIFEALKCLQIKCFWGPNMGTIIIIIIIIIISSSIIIIYRCHGSSRAENRENQPSWMISWRLLWALLWVLLWAHSWTHSWGHSLENVKF